MARFSLHCNRDVGSGVSSAIGRLSGAKPPISSSMTKLHTVLAKGGVSGKSRHLRSASSPHYCDDAAHQVRSDSDCSRQFPTMTLIAMISTTANGRTCREKALIANDFYKMSERGAYWYANKDYEPEPAMPRLRQPARLLLRRAGKGTVPSGPSGALRVCGAPRPHRGFIWYVDQRSN